MINYSCDHCKKALEVDDDLAAQRVECPFCARVTMVPSRFVARPGGAGEVGGPGAKQAQRAVNASGSAHPPDYDPARGVVEQHVLTVHPCMIRAHPLRAGLLGLLVIGGVAAFVAGFIMPGVLLVVTILGGVAMTAAGICLLVWFVRSRTVSLIVTNRRVTVRRGLFSRDTREVLHDRIQDFQITQDFLQRVLNCGRIGISSSGESGVEIDVADLPDPRGIQKLIDGYRSS